MAGLRHRPPGPAAWRGTAALAAHNLGDHRQASQFAAAALDRARETGLTAAIGTALRLTGLVARPGPDPDVLAEAVAVLAGTGAALEHARALVDLGSALRHGGRREASRRPLRDGLDLADRLHVRPLVERARAELRPRASGPAGRPPPVSMPLPRPSRRVALLALHGDGNGTIAQTLFITSKTVEAHLNRAYRKLGITSRRQLQEVFGPAAGPGAAR